MLEFIIYELAGLAERLIANNYEAEAGHELHEIVRNLEGVQASLRSLVGERCVQPRLDVHVAVSPEAIDAQLDACLDATPERRRLALTTDEVLSAFGVKLR